MIEAILNQNESNHESTELLENIAELESNRTLQKKQANTCEFRTFRIEFISNRTPESQISSLRCRSLIISQCFAPPKYIKSKILTINITNEITLITFNINGGLEEKISPQNIINTIIHKKKPDILGIIDTRHDDEYKIPNINQYTFTEITNLVKIQVE